MRQSKASFAVHWRNPGHWDIVSDNSRLFRIRGGPGKYWVADERPETREILDKSDYKTPTFKTVGACMTFITDELMFEQIVAEGQTPTVIESWNV
jgi:hypothetical protein